MSPFRSTPPPRRQQIVLIAVMLIGLVSIIAFRERCVQALTVGFQNVAPALDAGARAP